MCVCVCVYIYPLLPEFPSHPHLQLLFYIGIQLINNIVLISNIQQSDSVIHVHASVLFQILFPVRLLQNIEQSSLCYTIGPCWLSILNIYFKYSAVSMDQNVLHTFASCPLHGTELKSSSVILGAALSFPGSWKGKDLPEKTS